MRRVLFLFVSTLAAAQQTYNTNPQAIAFDNQRIRPMADKLVQSYYQAKEIVNLWNSQNVAAVMPPGDPTIIADGSQTDGRNPITNDNGYGIILQAQNLITLMEANNSANLVACEKAAVNVNP